MSSKTITGIVTWLKQWFYTKEEVDDLLLSDSGTQSCTISTGYSVYTSGTSLRVRKIGKNVLVNGVFKNNSQVTSTNNQIQFATLPSGYRPTNTQVKICQGSGVSRWLLRIYSNGQMTWERYGVSTNNTITSGSIYEYSICFMVD